MNIVAYYSGKSYLHCLDPRIKIIFLFLLTGLVFLSQNFMVLGIIFALALVLWRNAGLPYSILTGYFRFLLGISIFVILAQAIFMGGQVILVKPIIPGFVPLIGGIGSITLEGIIFGLLICLRMFILIFLMPLVTMTTPMNLFALGFVKLGLPYKIAFIATTSLNLIPTLQSDIAAIIEAQKLRGFTVFEQGGILSKIKAYPTLVVPLVIGAMRRAQLMGIAMDTKAFGVSRKRTYIEDLRFTPKDWFSLGVLLLLFCLLSWLSIVL
ncbi:energy-coupling factor transporter transmembrane component T [Bacillota bacterium LX-D]|nr:energy-coupling factor transporter transmembrane component T [Bacillota bacterium LX-D]